MYRARVGDVIEYGGHIGIIHEVIPPRNKEDTPTIKLDWISVLPPEFDFRSSHADADWYPVFHHVKKFKRICNVREKS